MNSLVEYISDKDKRRFWNKVDIKETNDCWNWKASFRNKEKYGSFSIDKTNYQAHRISWIISFGDIPDGLIVCHKCDNKSCCNPNHLFIGTVSDNNCDKFNKCREYVRRGTDHTNSKISEDSLKAIRLMLSNKISQRKIAKLFKVSQGCIAHINKGLTYKEIR
jgi:hypothetical protein